MTSRRFRVFGFYFPTAWDADGAVEQMHDVLNLLVDVCVAARDIPIVGGDFNGCIGLLESDDLTMLQHVAPVGMGHRNARGTMLMKLIHWTLQSNFYIFNRNGSRQGHESCMCRLAESMAQLLQRSQIRPLQILSHATILATVTTQTCVETVETNHG